MDAFWFEKKNIFCWFSKYLLTYYNFALRQGQYFKLKMIVTKYLQFSSDLRYISIDKNLSSNKWNHGWKNVIDRDLKQGGDYKTQQFFG